MGRRAQPVRLPAHASAILRVWDRRPSCEPGRRFYAPLTVLSS
ncbi:hypothetical protein HMPREF0742_02206 [Rothia aeria F0184]|uniref:Uncharacterized protein n=1 Tax=Rothia aeria F0184 TaxID=888019 RepID=U7V129_9MICC|nr:hypothetical protein HMPREF0742_02206 [Rothia aeria F0184]